MSRLTTAASPGKRALIAWLATCVCSSIQSAAFCSDSSPLRSHGAILKHGQKRNSKSCAPTNSRLATIMPASPLPPRVCSVRTFTSTTTFAGPNKVESNNNNINNNDVPPQQPIVGYHLDDEGDWVAELACGHNQHVRHNPPMVERPWVLTEKGRNKFLGYPLSCKLCLAEGMDMTKT